jgi:hypothetical protein
MYWCNFHKSYAFDHFLEMQMPSAKLTKGEITTMNFESMATMASWLSFASNVHDIFH